MESNDSKNNEMESFGFDDDHFLDNSQPPTIILPYKRYQKINHRETRIVPWSQDTLKRQGSVERRRRNTRSSYAKEQEKLAVILSRQIQKRKNKEEKTQQLKMNNNFLEFKVDSFSRGKRGRQLCKKDDFNQNCWYESSIPAKRVENTPKKGMKNNVAEKNPKIKFLERKFKLKLNTCSPDVRNKSLNFSTLQPSIDFDPLLNNSVRFSASKSSKRYNIFRPVLPSPLTKQVKIS